jgi:hypothetical protein
MSGMENEARTRYSVRRSRNEMQKERRSRYVRWGLIAAACVVIVVFAALLAMGAGA